MPTKGTAALSGSHSETFQTRDLQTWHVKAADLARAMGGLDIPRTNAAATATVDTIASVHEQAPKAAEAWRQVCRLKFAKTAAEAAAHADAESIASTIALLNNVLTGPIPVPVASWDPDSGPTLFFDHEGFYGDLEITGKTVEYFLKWCDEGGPREVFGAEDLEDGRIPPNLLMYLFSNFARTNAGVR